MKLFLILTGNGDTSYILATSEEDALKYFKDIHVMNIDELDVRMSIEALKYWRSENDK